MNQQSETLEDISLFGDSFTIMEGDLGIVIGNRQNVDIVAAALSLYLSLQQSGKKVQIVSLKEPLVEVSNLVGVNKIEKSFKGDTTKLVVALPYIKGEVEKVLFTEQDNTINFHLTAAQGRTITPFELGQVKLNWEGGAPTNIIVFGANNLDEISQLIDTANSKISNIDNSPSNSRFGQSIVVDDELSSVSEIVAKVIKNQRFPFDIDIAQNILDGVMSATRNLTKGNTSPLAFEAVSYAMYQGAQRKADERPQPVSNQRNDQGFTPSNRPQSQDRQPFDSTPFDSTQGRQARQGQDRGNNQPRQPFDSAQGKREQRGPFGDSQGKQSRVNNNDFPAMHMQDIRNQIQANDNNRRVNNNQPRQQQNPRPNMTNPNRNANPVLNNPFDQNIAVEDAQIVDENPILQKPIVDEQIPESASFDAPNPEDVPDDWLMPKVFKSSKSNN